RVPAGRRHAGGAPPGAHGVAAHVVALLGRHRRDRRSDAAASPGDQEHAHRSRPSRLVGVFTARPNSRTLRHRLIGAIGQASPPRTTKPRSRMSYDLVIRHGQLITPQATLAADVGIDGERIAAIGHGLRGQREISARGLYVIPGAIDGHVHLTDPDYAPLYTPNADSFAVGTRAAAFGGVTSFVDFAAPKAGLDLVESLERRRKQADGQVVTDYALNLTLRDTDPERLKELPAIFERGV